MTETSLSIAITPEVVEAIARRAASIVLKELSANAPQPAIAPYMTIPEAAEYLRCSRQRVDDLLSQGRLRRFKDGARTLLSRSEVERYVRPC